MCDMIYTSNPVLADCPPIKEEQDMNRQSDKITAIYCMLHTATSCIPPFGTNLPLTRTRLM